MRSYTDLPRAARLTVFIVVALFALSAITLLVFRVARLGALPGMSVAGVDVGGLSGEELRSALQEARDERGGEPLEVAVDDDDGAVTTTGADMGYRIDIAATVDQILERGRQTNPVAAFADHLLASLGTITIEPLDGLDDERFEAWQKDNDDKLSTQPFPGDLEFKGTEVTPRYPEPGVLLVEDELRDKAVRAARSPGEDAITISTREAVPPTDDADVDELAEEAEVVVSDAITFNRPNGQLVLTPKKLAGLLAVDVIEDRRETSLVLRVKLKVLRDTVGDRVAQLETEPQDASFQLSSGGVGVLPSVEGFAFAPKQTAKQILEVATKPNRSGKLRGVIVEADFTTKDARDLNITEQVSTFTTEHACCEPRVTNIHVIADMVDGVVVEPGESFSLNDFVGPRTTANGFVGAPAIRDGEFVEEIGGGISQFATTFFNAIYFGGYDFLEYQAHSYYISRYPMGREATISNPAPDLAFLNDSDAGIYIDTSYSDTSITVTFYGNVAGEVTSVSGEPYNYTEPERECRSNPDLAPGEEVVVDSGYTGFDIEVTRVFPDGREEDFFTRYNSGPLIVERRRC